MNKKVLFIINSLNFFLSHRYQIAKKLIKNGHEVILICEIDGPIPKYFDNKIKIHNIKLRNSNLNPINFIKNFMKLKRIIFETNPNIIHLITILPIFIGSMILYNKSKFRIVISFTGLGYFVINKNFFTFFFNLALYYYLNKLFIHNPGTKLIFQNKYDLEYVLQKTKSKIIDTILIPGSGVDLNFFKYRTHKYFAHICLL